MKAQTAKHAGAIFSAVALVSVGVAGAVPALASENAGPVAAEQTAAADAAASGATAPKAQGTFAFDQAKVSSSAGITEVFAKASVALCNGMPNYGIATFARAISVSGDVDESFAATVAEMAADAETRELVMACACASNITGGGAIINAEVSGVTLESIAKMAGA